MTKNTFRKSLGILAFMLLTCQAFFAQSALYFDGDNDYVQFANQSAYNFNSFTFEAWILPENPGSEAAILSNLDNSNNGVEWAIDQNGYQTLMIQGQVVTEPSVNLYDLQECTHIAVSYNSQSQRTMFFVNGAFLYQDVLPNVTATSSDLWLGADPSSFSKFYMGGMDEVRIWNYALTPDEIDQWYMVHCPDEYVDFLLYLDFNEDPATQIVHDLSPFANHGVRGSTLFEDDNDPKFSDQFCDFEDCCEVQAYFTGPLTTSVGTSVNYTNGSSAAAGYEWYIDGVLSSTSTNFSTSFGAPGTYVITLFADGDPDNCFDYYSLVVVVEGDLCDASFTYTTNCNTVSFVSTSTVVGLQHNWDFGDGASSTLANPTHVYLATGTYTVTHTVTLGETCTDIVTQQITISCFDDPCLDDCNIVPWGDFETQNITESLPLYAHNDLWLPTLSIPVANSVDLYNGFTGTTNSIDNLGITNAMLITLAPVVPAAGSGDEQYVGMGASRISTGGGTSISREVLTFELCEPIEPGGIYDISILLQLYVGNASNAVFRIQGSAEEACPFWTQGDLVICPDEGCNVVCNNANSYTPYDLAAYYSLNGAWTTHSSVYEHPATAPTLNYITIFPEVPCPNFGIVYVLADNVSICPSTATAGTPVVPNPNLNANFTYVVSPTDCPEVAFTAATSTGTHFWDFGDMNTSTAVNPTHLYAAQGTYTVIHTITDGECFSTEVMTVEVDCKGCQVDPWPKIYETTGPFNTRPAVLGLEFDNSNNVYTLRNNSYSYALPIGSATSVLTQYCEDGEELWSVTLTGAELTAYEPNSRLSVDDNGNSYVLVAYENSMNAGGTLITNAGTHLAVLRFDATGALLNSRSIPYVLTTGVGYGKKESIKVDENGNVVFVLMNDRIKQIDPVTLLDVTDEMGAFSSIDISDNGNYIYFVNSTNVGFFAGLGTTPVMLAAPTATIDKTDLEFDDVNDRLYLGSGYDAYVYDVTPTTIAANGISPMTNVFNSGWYHEMCPTPSGLLIYNVDDYYGTLLFEDIDMYDLTGTQQWNLPINGSTAPRSSIMMGYNNGYGYLGAMWWDNLNLGWYNTIVNSGSFVTRFDMLGNNAFKSGDASSSATDEDQSTSWENSTMVQLFPNPSNGEVAVEIVSDRYSTVNVSVVDAYGQVVRNDRAIDMSAGMANFRLNLSQEPAGVYFIVVESGDARISTSKLILQ